MPCPTSTRSTSCVSSSIAVYVTMQTVERNTAKIGTSIARWSHIGYSPTYIELPYFQIIFVFAKICFILVMLAKCWNLPRLAACFSKLHQVKMNTCKIILTVLFESCCFVISNVCSELALILTYVNIKSSNYMMVTYMSCIQ